MNSLPQQMADAKEKGQAIVFVALFMIILLGTLGVAIDGGGLFFLWRDSQNAADAATFAATFARCTGSNPENIRNAAYDAAEKNGFITSPSENRWVNVYPGNGTEQVDRNFDGADDGKTEAQFVKEQIPASVQGQSSNFVYVEVRAEKPKYFIQLLYPQPLIVNPNAIGYCDPGFDNSNLPGIVALGPAGCISGNKGEFDFSGSSAFIYVAPGSSTSGVHSNGDQTLGGSAGNEPTEVEVPLTSVGSAGYQSQQVTFSAGGLDADGNPAVYNGAPPIAQGTPSWFNIADWKPGGVIFETIKADTGRAYTNLNSSSLDGGKAHGLYYLKGNGSGSFSIPDFHANGATIIVEDAWIDIGNGGNWKPYNYLKSNKINGEFQPVMTFYTDWKKGAPACSAGGGGGNSGISGNGAQVGEGIVLAPFSTIDWSGNNSYFEGVMIGYAVDYSGADATYVINTNFIPSRPPKTSIAQ